LEPEVFDLTGAGTRIVRLSSTCTGTVSR